METKTEKKVSLPRSVVVDSSPTEVSHMSKGIAGSVVSILSRRSLAKEAG